MHTKSLLSSFLFRARTDLFLGRLRAPPDGFNNPADTRNRPGERFFCTRTGERRLPACKSRQLAETGFDSSLRVSHRMLPASCRQLQAGSLRSPEWIGRAEARPSPPEERFGATGRMPAGPTAKMA